MTIIIDLSISWRRLWTTSKIQNGVSETPFLVILVIALWPILLSIFAIFFIFTGRKVCDE